MMGHGQSAAQLDLDAAHWPDSEVVGLGARFLGASGECLAPRLRVTGLS